MRIHHVLGALSALLALSIASVSRAATGRHDGFYLEMTLGLGPQAMFARYTSDRVEKASSSGVAATGALLIGGSPMPGLVLGGGVLSSLAIMGDWTRSPPVTWDDGDNLFGSRLTLVGPFTDYYPNPARGFHVQALAGYASFTMKTASGNPNTPSGFGLMLGVGQDWSVSREWSLGLLARLVGVETSESAFSYPGPDVSQIPSERELTLSASLGLAATYY